MGQPAHGDTPGAGYAAWRTTASENAAAADGHLDNRRAVRHSDEG
jgi:hypothetical protein